MAVILIVEDEVLVGEIARLTIEEMGHDVLAAADMDEALLLVRSGQQIDALFTDIRLKTAVLGGYAVADQARELWPQVRVLYTSGSSLTDKIKAPFVHGAHFVQKPYSEEQLARAIEYVLAAEASARSTPLP